MLLNDDIVGTEKSHGICFLISTVNKFWELFLDPSIFSIKHSRSAIINGALSDVWHWLNYNILVSLEGITTSQKSLFSHTFSWNSRLSSVAKEWR